MSLVLLPGAAYPVCAGLRSLTAPARGASGRLSRLRMACMEQASWLGNFVTVVIVSVLAVAELVNDKRPKNTAAYRDAGVRCQSFWARSPARPSGAWGCS